MMTLNSKAEYSS